MTDLERLWDDYPTGPTPTREILAATAGRPRRRRPFRRALVTAGALTALVGAFIAGTLGQDGGGGGGDRTSTPRYAAFQADLKPAASCADLRQVYVDRGLDLVGPYGWNGGFEQAYARDDRAPLSNELMDSVSGLATANKSLARSQRQVNSETGTNVQEAGVDEPDTVKTDGSLLAVVRDDRLTTYDVTGAATRRLGSLVLPRVANAEILLDSATGTIIAVGSDASARSERTRVLTVSLAEPAEPAVTDQVVYDAPLLSARQHGSTVRLVLASGLPDLDFVSPGPARSPKRALAHNRKAVEESTIEDWLPTIAVDGDDPEQLLDCADVAVPSDDLALGTTSVAGFDAGSPGKVSAIGLAGRTDIAYESADHLYLAASGGWGGVLRENDLIDCVRRCPVWSGRGGTSYLFDFTLDGTRATHVASGEVEGSVRDRWSLDEADGVLRAAVGPTAETGNFNSVVTFERRGKELVERGRLDRLGPGEDLQSVRWFDGLAILVTFRQVDPLYAVDLTDTAHPRLLSKLKIPGFSSYLHPLGPARMVGVGEGPDGKGGWGAQIGLFDVRDPTAVKRRDVLHYASGMEALAGTDPRAFTWLPDQRTFLTVVQKWGSRRVGYLSVIRLEGGTMHEQRFKAEYGDDVDYLRAVPLPDGRVVVVTGEDARFFAL
ncbi:beta-propeller domain-containing protein [Pimelobacter simplex]|uniref:beta-propeller domain-containing protein n=1 Tax=Nocardioides simplex TaxID=2045 RepID=UPI003AAC22B3